MTIGKYHVSAHCWRRLAQRNITLSDLIKAIQIGRKIHRAHATFFWVGLRDIQNQRELERMVGTTIVIAGSEIVTAYRAKNAISKIKRKPKSYHGAAKRMRHQFEDLPAAA